MLEGCQLDIEREDSGEETQDSSSKMYKIRAAAKGSAASYWPHRRSRMLPLALCLLTSCLLVSSQATSTNDATTTTTSTTTTTTTHQTPTTTAPPNITTTTSSQTTTKATQPPPLPAYNGDQPLQQQLPTKPPVLRLSLEEEASALSRRYLNLVHENRRPRLPVSATQSLAQSLRPGNPDTESAVLSAVDTSSGLAPAGSLINHGSSSKQTVDAEQEITQSRESVASFKPTTSGASSSSSPLAGDSFFGGPSHELWQGSPALTNSQQSPTSQVTLEGAQAAPMAAKKQTGRRKKSGWSNQVAHQMGELEQCHQYLQRHSWPSSGSLSPVGPLNLEQGYNSVDSLQARLLTNTQQLLPCTCSRRSELHHEQLRHSALWLSCDHVQLMGSHFYSSSLESADAADRKSSLTILRFSQRDAGLQTLHSQKFHYLQLFHLKSIDLSHNRIRLIKLDAFHGIENELEHLDLSHNLLGDSRGSAISAEPSSMTSSGVDGESSNMRKKPPENNQKLIFASDELVRLGRLRWLSLHNNQIALLSASVFVKQQQEGSNQGMEQLIHLDLSENLLKSVPSDSIQSLSSLRTLKLNRNRIGQLDGDTRFPSSLTHLDLSDNLIRTIRRCQLIQLSELVEINLSHNQLSQLDKTAFISASWSSVASAADLLLSTSGAKLANQNLAKQHPSLAHHLSSSQPTSTRRRKRDLMSLLSEPAPLARQSGELHPMAQSVGGSQTGPEAEELSNEGGGGDELQVDESILSSITNLVTGSGSNSNTGSKSAAQEESLAHLQHSLNQFNSTLKLNLSYNFFQTLPGDSLVKFAGLQQLDLSYNRIRRLDSNYLCSLYNLVENLRELDLSGNLLSVSGSQPGNSTDETSAASSKQQLNKVFGCLQRLEKLSLSSNRLQNQLKPSSSLATESADLEPSTPSPVGNEQLDDLADGLLTDADESVGGVSWLTAEGQTLEMAREATRLPVVMDENRLMIRFGEGHASKHLNHLDLSDNQLTRAPLFQYIPQQQQVGPLNDTSSSQQTWHMSQWLGSRVSIQVLDLSYNYIERLDERDLEHLRNIRQLRLDYNRLLELPARLMRKFTSLDSISVEGNKLSILEPLNELFEKSSRTLRVLNLAYNRLSQWPTHMAATKAITPVAKDSQMADQQQQLQQSLAFVLEELNLEGNLLTTDNVTGLFEQLSYMRSLRLLKLSQNLLHRVKSEWFKFSNGNLRELVLTANRINTIDLGSFTRDQVNELTSLSLDYNLLRELKRKTFDSMPRIRELNLGNNFIHTINSETFYQINTLQVLKLNNNKLSSWRCEYFSHLCNTVSGTINADLLSLISDSSSSTAEANVTQTTGGQVSSLIELDLSHNSLSQLRVNSISVHTRLAKLNLSHNKLSFIPHDLFRASASGGASGRQVQLVSSLKYLNLANNRIQTVDNINFKPLKNLISLDLSFNELQTLGADVVIVEAGQSVKDERKININQPASIDSWTVSSSPDDYKKEETNRFSQRSSRSLAASTTNWPALVKLRHLNVAHNQLTAINQSLISELSPFALLNLNLSSNLLDSEALPQAFYTKISGAHSMKIYEIGSQSNHNNLTQNQKQQQTNAANYYDLVFTLKLESLDLSHNRLHEFPVQLLDNHYTSMETCNLAHNRIQDFLADSNLMIQIKSLNLEFNPLNRESNELILFEQKNARKLNLAATRLFAIHQATKELEVPSGIRKQNLTSSQLDLIRSINKPINAPYLRELNLSSNQLVWLAANVFDQLHSLRKLDLSNNQLTRLHLLNNQLMRPAVSLEHLNLASNLFTSIDQSDLSQLKSLQHLDLSNLLSLQRMNCRFLSKLSNLRALRLLNYPQLRRNTESLINNLKSSGSENVFVNDKLRRKMRNELMLSTLGRHCFVDEDYTIGGSSRNQERWYDLRELQLELFNDFSAQRNLLDFTGDFVLGNQIQPFLGPNTKKLILVGTNLTDLAPDSLSGILADELELKISYTSIYKVPLDQIFSGLSKKTKLDLDFRNNNIQLIEAKGLQLLDEFQLQNRLLEREDHSVLSLASNPIRCDCQARPLWLWLNQRWSLVDQLQLAPQPRVEQEASGETAAAQPTYWMKFKGLSRTSDLKCYQPTALRGKLTQHVFYNDLICHEDLQPIVVNRQSRRRVNDSVVGPFDAMDTADEELADSYEPRHTQSTRVVNTKFNRYNQQLPVQSAAQQVDRAEEELSSRQASSQQTKEAASDSWERSKKGKRDHASSPTRSKLLSSLASQQQTSSDLAQQQQQQVYSVSQYWRQPMGALSSIDNQLGGSTKGSSLRRAWLTDIDVLILTGISIAMAMLSLIIISVCLVKQKLDRSDEKQQMLAASTDSATRGGTCFVKSLSATSGGNASSSSASGRRQADKGSPGASSTFVDSNKSLSSKNSTKNGSHQTTTANNRSPSDDAASSKPIKRQVVVPIVNRLAGSTSQQPSANFLMRSPTIKRMHGLANNATDWFKFTLSKPAANLKQRGQLFRGARYGMTQQLRTPVANADASPKFDAGHRLLSVPEFVGCPVHEFACVQKLGTGLAASTGAPHKPLDEQCAHCQRLLAAMDGRHFMLSPASSSLSEPATSGVERPLVARPQVAPKPSKLRKLVQESNATTSLKQVKPMRTFGGPSASLGQQQQQQQQSSRLTELPSDAIEGRFAYQPESQLVSPGSSVASEQRAHKAAGRITVQWPPSSKSDSNTGNEELFILVAEEGQERRLKLMKRAAGGSLEMSEDDQCSNSSSPVAYGFMRSSSSIATTISSTPLRGHKYVPEYATSTKKAAHLYSTLGLAKSTTQPDDNNNNSNNEQLIPNKLNNTETAELQEQVAPTIRDTGTRRGSGDEDDRTIIISRL